MDRESMVRTVATEIERPIDLPLDGLRIAFEREFDSDDGIGVCGPWSVTREPWKGGFSVCFENMVAVEGKDINIPVENKKNTYRCGSELTRYNNISDKTFKYILNTANSVFGNCRMSGKEQARLRRNGMSR